MPNISICSIIKSTENSGFGNEWTFTLRGQQWTSIGRRGTLEGEWRKKGKKWENSNTKGKERAYFKWKRSKVSNATKKPRNTGTEQIHRVSQPSALAASRAWSHRALQIKAAYCCEELQNVSQRPPQFLNNGNTASPQTFTIFCSGKANITNILNKWNDKNSFKKCSVSIKRSV